MGLAGIKIVLLTLVIVGPVRTENGSALLARFFSAVADDGAQNCEYILVNNEHAHLVADVEHIP